jgi:predicted metal-dependent hydrolase
MKYVADTYKLYLSEHRRRQNKGAYGKDSEMQKVYDSEWAVKGLHGEKLESMKEAEKYMNRVLRSKTWSKLTRRKHIALVEMKDVSGGCAARAEYGGVIKIKQSHLYKYVLLHEMAHQAGHMHHGRSFRQALLKLTSQFIGREKADALKAEFKKRKLACGEPRKPLTEAQWNTRRERLL